MNTIKKNTQFQEIYNTNKKYFGKYLIVYIIKNNLTYSRIGVVASKKTGNAVIRNRIKRLFREVFRKNIENLKNNFDIILIAKKITGENISDIKYKDINNDFIKILKREGFLSSL